MDAIVTARVPVEIKEQGNSILKEMGSSASELVNSAYAYLLQYKELPCAHAGRTFKSEALSAEALGHLRADIHETTFDVPAPFWQGATDDEMLERGRSADYEALS